MPTTIKRQKIIDAVEARARTILTTDPVGYYSNLGTNVFVWLSRPLQNTGVISELPALVLRPTLNEPIELRAGSPPVQIDQLMIDWEIIAAPGSLTEDRVWEMIIDWYKAIGTDPTWTNLASDTNIGPDSFDYDQKENTLVGASGSIVVVYRHTQYLES